MATITTPKATTFTIARNPKGARWHRVSGDAQACNHSGTKAPVLVGHVEVTEADLRNYARCARCFPVAKEAPKATPKAAPKAKKAPVAYCSECGQPAQPNAAGDGGFVSECCTGNLLKRAPKAKAPKAAPKAAGAECSKGRLAKWAAKEGYEMATGPDAVVITTLEGIFAATSSAHITIRWADWSSARLAYGAALAALKQGLV